MNSWSVAVEAGKEGLMGRESGQTDEFPVGMRVLAVDDDLTSLKVLEALLLRCRYHERESSMDVVVMRMKLHRWFQDSGNCEPAVGRVRLYVLSVNSEIKTVMKGITHGACDYLLKPVRIEELRNIWQHVFRRKNLHHRDYSKFDNWEESHKHQNELSNHSRVVWSIDRHQQFVAADNQLGIDSCPSQDTRAHQCREAYKRKCCESFTGMLLNY
ncbi:unnamed protein product, partial [Musa hybrid cultivar]